MTEGLWRELWQQARDDLDAAGITSTDVDARRIVECAAGAAPAEFFDVLERPATRLGVARLDEMLGRRCRGEPLQYVLGSWAFRSLDLMVDRRVLIPRPETEITAGWAISEANRLAAQNPAVAGPPGGAVADPVADAARNGGPTLWEGALRGATQVTVADLGTGSGAIALSVAIECPTARVFATDLSPEAVAVASANLAGLGRAATRVTVHTGHWFDALDQSLRGTFDVIVSNPPYVGSDEDLPAVVADWEPQEALRAGPRGHEQLHHIVERSPGWLRPGGSLVVELAPHQAEPMSRWATRAGFGVSIKQDLSGRDRVLVASLP